MQLRKARSVLLCLIGMFLSATAVYAQNAQEHLLQVNGDSISTWYFTRSYIHHLRSTGLNDTREERYAHLDVLINEILLAQQVDDLSLNDDEQNFFKEKVKKKVRSDIFYNRAFMDTLSLPSDLQVRNAFMKSKMKIYTSQLFFTDQAQAEEYFQRIKAGESFTDLANELYDLAEYDSLAGYLGEMTYFSVDADVAEILFDMRAGQISQPVRSRFGYHIFRVEERIANPLITEAEFQYRYEGVTDQEKRRILAMKGDQFVRDYMGSLRISVDTTAVRQLYTAISAISSEADDPIQQVIPRESLSDQEIQFVSSRLNPQTTVATYEHLGNVKSFTVADYLFWLEFIPFGEARYRTMASVGRALRDQVFSEAAAELDLQNDPDFQFEMEYHMDNYNSWRVKKHLLEQKRIPVPDTVLIQAFRNFGLNTVKEAIVTGWVIETDTFQEARAMKEMIASGNLEPEDQPGFRAFDREDVRTLTDLRTYFFKVIPGSVHVLSTEEGSFLMYVHSRELIRDEFEDVRDEVLKRLGNSYNITYSLKELRKNATIEVDTTRFEKLMEHFNDPALRGQNP